MAITNIMLDLETLGTRPGCAILAIGAVAFDENGQRDAFYQVVNTSSCTQRYGLKIEADTTAWWARQSDEAKAILAEAEASKVGLSTATARFTDHLCRIAGPQSIRIWGNGADFDPVILRACFDAVGQEWPWKYAARCYRTLRDLAGRKRRPAALVKHHALYDAQDQAAEAIEILKTINFNGQGKLL